MKEVRRTEQRIKRLRKYVRLCANQPLSDFEIDRECSALGMHDALSNEAQWDIAGRAARNLSTDVYSGNSDPDGWRDQ